MLQPASSTSAVKGKTTSKNLKERQAKKFLCSRRARAPVPSSPPSPLCPPVLAKPPPAIMLARRMLIVGVGSAALMDVLMCVPGATKYSKQKKESSALSNQRKLNNQPRSAKRSKIPKQQKTK